jgi:hypothetical protein
MIEWTVTTVIAGASELVTVFLKTTVYIILGLTYLILQPIDAMILQFLPDLSNAFTGVADFLNLISGSIGWAISVAGLSSATITLIVAFYVFKLTAPMFMYMLKLALAWYDKIRG